VTYDLPNHVRLSLEYSPVLFVREETVEVAAVFRIGAHAGAVALGRGFDLLQDRSSAGRSNNRPLTILLIFFVL